MGTSFNNVGIELEAYTNEMFPGSLWLYCVLYFMWYNCPETWKIDWRSLLLLLFTLTYSTVQLNKWTSLFCCWCLQWNRVTTFYLGIHCSQSEPLKFWHQSYAWSSGAKGLVWIFPRALLSTRWGWRTECPKRTLSLLGGRPRERTRFSAW